mmetsp:Transcript_25200/g.60609  ORF Transcript_25200/g.60609 Transcript_25200/m.60609 type:complete len:208 (-) Transcript_25200:892-1515(-)
MEVIKEGVSVDEQSGHSRVDEGAPPPSMVFPRQLEVQQRHADEGRDDDEEDEGEEEDAKEGVDLVSPHGREDVMELDVDGREGQESRHDHLEEAAAVPGHLRGNLARHLGRAGGRIEIVARVILRGDPSQHREGKRDERVQRRDGEDGREGEGARGSVHERDGVHPHEDDGRGRGEERCREEDAAHPRLPSHLKVQAGGDEAARGAG